jgi:hypothetical protein
MTIATVRTTRNVVFLSVDRVDVISRSATRSPRDSLAAGLDRGSMKFLAALHQNAEFLRLRLCHTGVPRTG